MFNRRKTSFMIVFLIVSILLNINSFILASEQVKGNTSGNIINLGYISQDEEWLYYSNIADESKFYKSKLDGSGEVKLSDDVPNFINIAGDWVYYSNVKDGFKMYKIKKDGTERVRLNNESSFWLQVQGDWIYFARSEKSGQKLYKITLDGKNKTKVINDLIYGFTIVGDWIFYSNESDGHKIYKTNLDGSNAQKLNEDQSFYLNSIDNNIYYQNFSDDKKIYKIDLDGKNKVKLNDDQSEYVNASGEWIYYINSSDNSKIYKINKDGTSRAAISDEGAAAINIINNSIYYWKLQKDANGELKPDVSTLNKINTDGSDKKTVKVATINKDTVQEESLSPSSIAIIAILITVSFALEVWKLISIRRLSKFVSGLNEQATNADAENYINIIRTSRIPKKSDTYKTLREGLEKISSSPEVSQELKDTLKDTLLKRRIILYKTNK